MHILNLPDVAKFCAARCSALSKPVFATHYYIAAKCSLRVLGFFRGGGAAAWRDMARRQELLGAPRRRGRRRQVSAIKASLRQTCLLGMHRQQPKLAIDYHHVHLRQSILCTSVLQRTFDLPCHFSFQLRLSCEFLREQIGKSLKHPIRYD